MNLVALVCPKCGGPLAKPAAVPSVVECGFCGVGVSVGDRVMVTRECSPDEARYALVRQRRVKFQESLAALLKEGKPAYDALVAATAHLGVGDTDTVARVTIAIARDFEAETGAKLLADGIPLARVAEGYLKAIEELQTQGETEINLPFLTVTKEMPVHLQRKVTAVLLGELAARDPHAAVAPARVVEAAVEEPPKKKKRFWLF